MVKTAADVIEILRNVTGRVDSSDPQFTDEKMLDRVNDVLTIEKSTDLRLKEKQTWWEFTLTPLTPNPLPVDLQAPFGAPLGTQFTTIGPLCYCDGFEVFWFEDPASFYAIWPETQLYQPQRPTYVLYYNNELTWRGPADRDYFIKMSAYQVDLPLTQDGPLAEDYYWRYIAYMAASDLFNDYGEVERDANIQPKILYYRNKVYARTYQQQQPQRSTPRF